MTTPPAYRPTHAILWMVLSGLCFVGVQATVKHLGPSVPPAEAVFLRFVLGWVFLIPMWPALRAATITRRAWRLAALRGATQAFAVLMWFFAMTRITLGEVTAMNFMSPIYITLGAALFLGEPLAARRLVAIGVAFLGALIILRPGMRSLDPGHVAMIFAALGFAATYLTAKKLSLDLGPTVVVALMSLLVPVFLAPFAVAVWVTPTAAQLGWLFVVAAFATAGHYTMTLAFREGPMAVTQPVTFLQLVWASLMGLLVFGEPIDGWVLLGGGMIMLAVSFIAWREARLRATRPAPTTPSA